MQRVPDGQQTRPPDVWQVWVLVQHVLFSLVVLLMGKHLVLVGQQTGPFGDPQTWPVAQHTPFTQVLPVGQQTSPVDERQGGLMTPCELTQRQTRRFSTTTHLCPCGQQTPSHGGWPVSIQRQLPSTQRVPGGQQWMRVPPVVGFV